MSNHKRLPIFSRQNSRIQFWNSIDRISHILSRRARLSALWVCGIGFISAILIASFLADRFEAGDIRFPFAVLVLIGFILALLFSALLGLEIASLLRNRRDSGLTQRRLITLFVGMALAPTVFVAIFSTIVLNFGIENWFSARVRNVVDASYEIAQKYDVEHQTAIFRDGLATFERLNLEISNRRPLRVALSSAHEAQGGSIAHSFIIDGQKNILARGPKSYLFDYYEPNKSEMNQAISGEIVLIKDPTNNEYRYLRALPSNPNQYLYLSRDVDGELLSLLGETEKTAAFYRDSEQARQKLLVTYGLFFLLISILVLLAAIWAAIYFSSRLTRPIAKLVTAAERISSGDMSARVLEVDDESEFGILSKSFNKMAEDVENNEKELIDAGKRSEAERKRFNKVLEGVSAGVLGVDAKGKVNFMNSAAKKLLGVSKNAKTYDLREIAPEFVNAHERVFDGGQDVVQEQIALIRGTTHETVFLRATASESRKTGNSILSFDVVSDLVQAQRLAAWGDVARRIAHEIKNPLTPIRLSAERIHRRFGAQIETDHEKFKELTNVIVRQTQDIQRIVDEFARFSRMPEANQTPGNWIDVIREGVALFEGRESQIKLSYTGPQQAMGSFDQTLMRQAFTNLIKNAMESVEARMERTPSPKGEVLIKAQLLKNYLEVELIDNGLGFPVDKARLFEPYMTTKESGTGLGLPIVKKIIDDHEGKISLNDRTDQQSGARISIRLPITNLD